MSNDSRGIRNNNPGNIRKSKDKWQGLAQTQDDPSFFTFESPKWGIRALARILIKYDDDYELKNVRDIISRWAPSNENDTAAYIRSVSTATSFPPEQTLDMHNYADIEPLVKAIITHENGKQPYSQAIIDEGLRLAGVSAPVKPALQSKTIQGSLLAGGGGAIAVAQAAEPYLPVVQNVMNATDAKWLIAAAGISLLIGVALVLYSKFKDRKVQE